MFGKKSKVFCFYISNFDEIYEKDIEFSEKIEESGLLMHAYPAKLNTEEGIFCVTVDYKKNLEVENSDFSVEKMKDILFKLGCNVTSVEEE